MPTYQRLSISALRVRRHFGNRRAAVCSGRAHSIPVSADPTDLFEEGPFLPVQDQYGYSRNFAKKTAAGEGG
jgi:hypothetical protein